MNDSKAIPVVYYRGHSFNFQRDGLTVVVMAGNTLPPAWNEWDVLNWAHERTGRRLRINLVYAEHFEQLPPGIKIILNAAKAKHLTLGPEQGVLLQARFTPGLIVDEKRPPPQVDILVQHDVFVRLQKVAGDTPPIRWHAQRYSGENAAITDGYLMPEGKNWVFVQ